MKVTELLSAYLFIMFNIRPALAILPRDLVGGDCINVLGVSYTRCASSPLPVFWDWLRSSGERIVGIHCSVTEPLDAQTRVWLTSLSYCTLSSVDLDVFFDPERDAIGDGSQMLNLGFFESQQGHKALLLPLFQDEESQLTRLLDALEKKAPQH